MSSRVMKLVDGYAGMMECKVCGSVHYASLKRGGGYVRGSWSCVHRCRMPTKTEPQALNGYRQKWVNPEDMHIAPVAPKVPA